MTVTGIFWKSKKNVVLHCTVRLVPCPSTISLSIPLGPRVVATASTITSQALMLLIIWGFPWEESVPSFRRMIGVGWREREGGERKREREGGEKLNYYVTFMINGHWQIDLNTSYHHLRRFLSATWLTLDEIGHVLRIIELRPFDRAKRGAECVFRVHVYTCRQCGLDIIMNFEQVYSWSPHQIPT